MLKSNDIVYMLKFSNKDQDKQEQRFTAFPQLEFYKTWKQNFWYNFNLLSYPVMNDIKLYVAPIVVQSLIRQSIEARELKQMFWH